MGVPFMANVFLVPGGEPSDQESVLTKPPGDVEPFITGAGDVTLKCGTCKHVLARKMVSASQVSRLVLQCPRCGDYNRART